MSRDERPLAAVPRAVWLALAAALAIQVGGHGTFASSATRAAGLPPAPDARALRLASLGEPAAAARLAMLYLQSFDLGGGEPPYQRLDYARLIAWLRATLQTDPRSSYPLFSAARLYAENKDPAKVRSMLDFIYAEFPQNPNRRWPWLAQAALIAKHELHDLPLARRYAAAIDRLTTASDVPLWAKQMEIFILEDMNELEAAKVMLGGLIASGKVADAGELRFLKQRLEEMEKRLAQRNKSSGP